MKNGKQVAVATGPSPQFQKLIRGEISSKDYVRQVKERVDAERRQEKRAVRRAAA
jgi:hypothetical protein